MSINARDPIVLIKKCLSVYFSSIKFNSKKNHYS